MARCGRRSQKCSRAALLAGVVVVGLLLVRDHYESLDELMPAPAAGRGSSDEGVGEPRKLPPAFERAPLRLAKAGPPASGPGPGRAPGGGRPPPRTASATALPLPNASLLAGHQANESEDAAPVLSPVEVQQLRRGLVAWLAGVATFQEVDVVYLLHQWFQHADTKEVGGGLAKLLPSSGWSTCAVEDETCNCPSGSIRYGHVEKSWIPKHGRQVLQCTLGTFGNNDVAVGLLKQCQCLQSFSKTVAVQDLREVAASLDAGGGSLARGLWSSLASIFRRPSAAAAAAAAPAPSPPGPGGEPPGSLWHRSEHLAEWVQGAATSDQLVILAQVYTSLESTRSTAQMTVAIERAAAEAMARKLPACPDGKPLEALHCAGSGQYYCRAGCERAPPPAPGDARTTASPGDGGRAPRAVLCGGDVSVELLWSCSRAGSRLPAPNHPHAEAQRVLERATEVMCSDVNMREQMAVYLDCEFLPNYLRWTTEESEWLEEAYVTYVGGQKDSLYEWQATNLVRSVDLFSSRPIVVVVFGSDFVPPASWQGMPNIIVFKMKDGLQSVSFNFNKIRSMLSSRVLVAIQLDTDQLIAPGMDQLFAGTRREITAHYPWPMMPVHWMSREGKKPEPYWEYAFREWQGKRSMRWGHAHPSWSYWALPFLGDLLHERLIATIKPEAKVLVWDLEEAVKRGLLHVLEKGIRMERLVRRQGYMREDEDMLNVGLWRDSAKKDWCKYDLEWGLFKERFSVDVNLYWDSKWYPKGLPVIYISMHNTKQFEITDWLLSLVARCDKERPKMSCPWGKETPKFCKDGSMEERKWRRNPAKYAATLCCCLEPRQQTKIYWGGQWFAKGDQVPMKLPSIDKPRTCLFP